MEPGAMFVGNCFIVPETHEMPIMTCMKIDNPFLNVTFD
jgi:hypothetical protein